MPIFATAGSKVFIGQATPAKSTDFVEADFTGMSWTEIRLLESIGEFGDESAEITFDAIGEGRTQKLKGVRNAGNMDLIMGVEESDSGQQALLAAEATPDDFAFRVDFNNEPAGGGSPSQRFFIGKVMTARERLDTANSVVRRAGRVAINSNVVRVPAA